MRVAVETQFAIGTPTGLGVYARNLYDALNQLIDVIHLRSGTLLSRKADDTRSVSGMHTSLDAVWLRTGYEPASEPGKETAGFAELVSK